MSETYSLRFGTLDWSPSAQVGPVGVRVYGLRRGRTVPVVSVVDSLIQDGAIEQVERYDNRDTQVLLAIDAPDALALAEYESALFRECQKPRTELSWTPPDAFGPTGVFDVLWADCAFLDEDATWDLDEVKRGRRNYVVTFRCLPFARSVDPFTVTGFTNPPAAPITTTVDDGTSATGWSAVYLNGGAAPAPVSTGGRISFDSGQYSPGGNNLASNVIAVRTGAIDMSATTYLSIDSRVDFNTTGGSGGFLLGGGIEMYADGALLTRISTVTSPADSTMIRSTFVCPDTSVNEIRVNPNIYTTWATLPTSYQATVLLDNLIKTNQAPAASTTGREKVVEVQVPGSARCPMTLQVSHATSSLGDVLVYSSPALVDGYVPNIMQWATSTRTTDASTVSGSRITTSTGRSFDVPTRFLPEGTFQVVARMRRTSGGTSQPHSVSAVTRVGGVDVGPAQVETTPPLLIDSTWRLYSLGALHLPPTQVSPMSSGVVRVTVTAGVTDGDIDEVWLFHLPDDNSAHLSMLACGTAAPSAGGSSNRVWLEAPTVTRPFPRALVGYSADQSDARQVDGATSAWDEHTFTAGTNQVFVVTTDAVDALVTGQGYATWLTNPAA